MRHGWCLSSDRHGQHSDGDIYFPSGMEKMGPVCTKLRETLTGIQMGEIEGPEGWVVKIDAE